MSSGDLAFGVIGLGFGANHARVLSGLAGVKLAAVCDTDAGRLASVARARSATPYREYKRMLSSEHLDAVVIALPASMHEAATLAAIHVGCAVLVEKPLAPSLEAGQRIVRAAALAGVALMAGHIERFNPALQELALRVRRGECGRVLQVTARRMAATRLPPDDVNVVYDSALHDIDAMRYVVGAEVAEVYAAAHAGLLTPVENSLAAILHFEAANGIAALGSIEVNWLSPRRIRDLTVLGDEGAFTLDYAAQTLEFYKTRAVRTGPVQDWESSRHEAGEGPERVVVEPREQLVLELEAFVCALRGSCPMPVSSEDALAALAVADALTESARTGRPIVPRRWSADD